MKGLTRKFQLKDLEWRIQSQTKDPKKLWGICIPYLTSRAVMDRLDEVAGLGGWSDEYSVKDGIFQCTLKIKIGEEWVSKTDASTSTKVEPVKGGYSDSFKRAAVKWGIGRYLYECPQTFVKFVDRGAKGAMVTKIDGGRYYWIPDISHGFFNAGN